MARAVQHIITDIRDHTENAVVNESDNTGIEDSEFLRFMNDATFRLHSRIVQQHPSVFIKEYEVSVSAGDEEITLPADIMLGNKVTMVEYKESNTDYYVLYPGTLRHRQRGNNATPRFYIRHTGKILLSPKPSISGTVRIHYIRAPHTLDIKRGSVAVATLNTTARTITTLTLDVSTDAVDTDVLDKYRHITIVDKNGEIQMENIEVDDIDGATGVVTVASGFVYSTGETIAVGDYVLAGPHASTHLDFPDSVERYLIAYCAWKIMKRDSSTDSIEQTQELLEMESEIIASYADIDDDITPIPEIKASPSSDDWEW